jgi:hypothetical protein
MVSEMVPGYFKKVLDDLESEWSQNKKVIDTQSLANTIDSAFINTIIYILTLWIVHSMIW